MSRRSRRGGEEENEINMTPMLDVVFIMLIFFIVTASFVKESGLELNKPDGQQSKSQSQNETILVIINESGVISMPEAENPQRTVDIRAVRPNIERRKAEAPNAPIIVRTHPNAKNGVFTAVLDQAKEVTGATPQIAPWQ